MPSYTSACPTQLVKSSSVNVRLALGIDIGKASFPQQHIKTIAATIINYILNTHWKQTLCPSQTSQSHLQAGHLVDGDEAFIATTQHPTS